MAKPTEYMNALCRAVSLRGAALLLCVLLVFGLLWRVPLSFAASEKDTVVPEATEEAEVPKAPVDIIDNVVVEAPSDVPAPIEPEPVAPEAPTVPEYENAWPIGADEASSIVAELWDDGTFVVDGAGEALSFDRVEDVPWLAAGVADDIKRVIFADKVEPESLAYWFEGCSNLTEVANVPTTVKDLTRAFYDCPKLVELPDEFALVDDAVTESCFGFTNLGDEPLTTLYLGADENVLAYEWELDGRVLVNPDASEPPTVEEPEAPDVPTDEPADDPANEPAGEPTEDPTETPLLDESESDLAAPEDEAAPEADPESAEPEQTEPDASPDAQVNITIPSSVSMMLGEDDPNAATIPVMVANRSERAVAITGARLKRSDMDLPGGSWSLSTQGGATTFVQDARFTPLGLEVTFDRPVILAAGDMGTQLVWHGTFTDHGMKTLLEAVLSAGDTGFTYGSMIWIVSAA